MAPILQIDKLKKPKKAAKEMRKNKLLQVSTSDNLYLHGYYVPAEDKKIAVLHIHGFEGNFYENNFVHVLAKELENKNIGFLTVNTRGNGRDTDIKTVDGTTQRIGARYELLEKAHLDITVWLKFLVNEGYKKIVLQGHSLGTMKVTRYLFEGELKDKISKLILLCPFDKKGYMFSIGRKDIDGLLKKAQIMVNNGKGDELITPEFDQMVFSYKTFISWYKQDDFGRIFEFCNKSYEFPLLKKIGIPTKIIVGSKDEFFHLSNPEHPEEAMELLLKHIPNSQGEIIDDAIHSFRLHEDTMTKEISCFVLNDI